MRGSVSCASRRSLIEPSSEIADLQQIHGDRDRLTVEVAAGDDVPASCCNRVGVNICAVGEDQRVVGRGIDLDLEHSPDVGERIGHRAVDLRNAPYRIGILDLVRLAVMRAHELRVAQERTQLGGHRC